MSGDIQFWRGHVNEQAAAVGRFGGSAPAPSTAGPGDEAEPEFTFDDFLDIINPLQHIPVVSSLYRELTGDEISASARVIGGTLFGGPGGFVSAVANTLFDEVAGDDIGASVLAWFDGDDDGDAGQMASDDSLPGAPDPFAAAPLETAAGAVLPTDPPPIAPVVNSDPTGFIPTALPMAPVPPQPGKPEMPAAGRQESRRDTPLTGQAALNALFQDLRGGTSAPVPETTAATAAIPMPPEQSANQQPLARAAKGTRSTPAAPPESGTNPLLYAAQAPDAALAERMLTALDKYRAMSQQRQQPAEQDHWKAAAPLMAPAP